MKAPDDQPHAIGDLLQDFLATKRLERPASSSVPPGNGLAREERRPATAATPVVATVTPPAPDPCAGAESFQELPPGRYDFDLAEFPLFRLHKPRLNKHDTRVPLAYTDTITGKGGQPIVREWKAYPSPYGFGGASTQALLFDLLQLYVEQGARGTQIQFGTLRALFQRRGDRNPSNDDYARLRRDIKVLCGYRFECKNAFWDREKQAYVDMDQWSLFTGAFYFKEKADDWQQQLPFGFIGVHPILQQVARTRGFFALGFAARFFHGLKPLEGRLAIYLAKRFMTESFHRRFVDDLARALPIEATLPGNIRASIRTAAEGLLAKKIPILGSFAFEKSRDGRWLAVFRRKAPPKQDVPFSKQAAEDLGSGIAALVDRMIEATGNAEDRAWWTQCAKRLGQGGIDRALGQLKETRQINKVRNPGGMLTKILQDISKESGIALRD